MRIDESGEAVRRGLRLLINGVKYFDTLASELRTDPIAVRSAEV